MYDIHGNLVGCDLGLLRNVFRIGGDELSGCIHYIFFGFKTYSFLEAEVNGVQCLFHQYLVKSRSSSGLLGLIFSIFYGNLGGVHAAP